MAPACSPNKRKLHNYNQTEPRTIHTTEIPNSSTYQTWKKLVVISNTEKQRKMIADITNLGIN